MREYPQLEMVRTLWVFIIILFVTTALHMLITWLTLDVIAQTKSRLDALEQHCGYALDKDTP